MTMVVFTKINQLNVEHNFVQMMKETLFRWEIWKILLNFLIKLAAYVPKKAHKMRSSSFLPLCELFRVFSIFFFCYKQIWCLEYDCILSPLSLQVQKGIKFQISSDSNSKWCWTIPNKQKSYHKEEDCGKKMYKTTANEWTSIKYFLRFFFFFCVFVYFDLFHFISNFFLYDNQISQSFVVFMRI